jgi:hypothetical protein
MSNIAGKSYAMNVVTPMRWWTAWRNRFSFWITVKYPPFIAGLLTLSLIHYARWVIIKPSQFPQLGQPPEDLKYTYMLFCSNFNGSWDQYVDSFSSSISGGLDAYWYGSIKYPKSVPMLSFHRYITSNQIWTDHYYNPYPMATSNDVKAAARVKTNLLSFIADTQGVSADHFEAKYNQLLTTLQHDLGQMGPNPIVSLSAAAVEKRAAEEHGQYQR